MAVTESTMLPLGTKAPQFSLRNSVDNTIVSLDDLKSPEGTVIMFICNHCPFVKHVQEELIKLAKDYQAKGIAFIAINSNDPIQYPSDGPEHMAEIAREHQYPFPYLFDETQEIAKAYHAACTPDFYVFDGNLHCVYRGQLDDSRPNNGIPVTGSDLRKTLDALRSGSPISPQQKPSIGCNIKWK